MTVSMLENKLETAEQVIKDLKQEKLRRREEKQIRKSSEMHAQTLRTLHVPSQLSAPPAMPTLFPVYS